MMHKDRLIRLGMLVVVVASLTAVGCGTGIPSGHRGVFFSRFGDGTEFGKIYPEGFTFHFPWNSMFVYQIQLQERKEDIRLLSSDGAEIQLEVSILYRPIIEKLDSLQAGIGRNYYEVAVAPLIRSIAREVGGRYRPEEIYSTKREELTTAIFEGAQSALLPKWVMVEGVLIRDVQIPKQIADAINFKLTADQEAQRMEFTIERERLEADRKRIEAQGIADFQKIVSTGLTKDLLQWKGIEATEKLAESPNAKVIVIGGGEGGLPIILNPGQ